MFGTLFILCDAHRCCISYAVIISKLMHAHNWNTPLKRIDAVANVVVVSIASIFKPIGCLLFDATCAIKFEHHFNCYIVPLFILWLFFVFALFSCAFRLRSLILIESSSSDALHKTKTVEMVDLETQGRIRKTLTTELRGAKRVQRSKRRW